MNCRRILSVLAALAAISCLILVSPSPVAAQEAVVSDCSSDADLRAKMADIEAQGSGTIKIVCPVPPGTIILNGTPLPNIHANMTIIGNGVTISGNNNTAIFSVESDGALTLRGVTLTRAVAAGNGGAIASVGALTIVDSSITDSQSTAGNGGAIAAWGSVTIRNSYIAFNRAVSGGAIYADAGATVTIDRSNFTENQGNAGISQGGALLLTDGAHTISDSVFIRNQAHYGAGIALAAASTLDIEHTRFIENVSRNGGSAIYYQGSVTIRRSSFVDQSSSAMGTGGVLSGDGTLLVENSTFSGNVGPSVEPYGSGATEIRFSTIVDGRSAGFQAGYGILTGSSVVSLQNTILAGNTANCQVYGAAILTSQGNNLSSDVTCVLAETGDRTGTDPLLSALQGGQEAPHYLIPEPGSPAIDTGVCVPAIRVDLRGFNRPAGAACDIGAIEAGATPTRFQWIPAVRK